jgi:hypothetical protein
MTAAQVKFELQSGSTVHDRRRRLRRRRGQRELLDVAAGYRPTPVWLARWLLSCSNRTGGVSFWDAGQLQNRLYNGSGIRLINLLELPGSF